MGVAIYGAGEYGKSFFRAFEAAGIEVDFFIDQYTQKSSCCNIPIKRIEDIKNKDIKIYISVALNDNDMLVNFLSKNSFFNVVDFKKSLREHKEILIYLMKTNILWMRENNSKYLDGEKLEKFKNLLADDESKNILQNIINFRKTLDMNYYISPQKQYVQYFPDDFSLFNDTNSIKMVDCGAYIGDTIPFAIQYAQKYNFALKSIICFEADKENTKKLNTTIKEQIKKVNTEFIVYPMGVYDKVDTLYFNADGNSSSSIVEDGSENVCSISVVDLDSTLYGYRPNFIKMDVEGAEIQALNGAKNIIKDFSPTLAICLYHRPQDLYEIPLLIDSINQNYDMYLRVYGHMFLETVLYCIKKDGR